MSWSEDKMPHSDNLTLILTHTLTGYCPFQFLSTHTLSFSITLHINTRSLYTLYRSISLSLYSHTLSFSLHTDTLSLCLFTHTLSICLYTDTLSLCLYTRTLSISLFLSIHIHCVSLSLCQ